MGNSGAVTTSGGTITLDSDSDGSGVGAITLGAYTHLTSNGGDITLSGGANVTTGYARSIYLDIGNGIDSGSGNIVLRGIGAAGGGRGVYAHFSSLISSMGNITVTGTGIGATDGAWLDALSITTGGNISVTGTAGSV